MPALELDLNESLGKRRIAEWNKAHRHLYDGRKFYNRSEEYQKEYIDKGAVSLCLYQVCELGETSLGSMGWVYTTMNAVTGRPYAE